MSEIPEERNIEERVEQETNEAEDLSNQLQEYRKVVKGVSDDTIDTVDRVGNLSDRSARGLIGFGIGFIGTIITTGYVTIKYPLQTSVVAGLAGAGSAVLVLPESPRDKRNRLEAARKSVSQEIKELPKNSTPGTREYDIQLTSLFTRLSSIDRELNLLSAASQIQSLRTLKAVLEPEQYKEQISLLLPAKDDFKANYTNALTAGTNRNVNE